MKLDFEQKVISNLSRKNRNIYPLPYLLEFPVGELNSSFTNTHKHSRITIYFNGLVMYNKSRIVLASSAIIGQLLCFNKNKLGIMN